MSTYHTIWIKEISLNELQIQAFHCTTKHNIHDEQSSTVISIDGLLAEFNRQFVILPFTCLAIEIHDVTWKFSRDKQSAHTIIEIACVNACDCEGKLMHVIVITYRNPSCVAQ